MATPPFEVEEQTDEDFFDKLVDGDIDVTDSNRGSTVGIVDSDEANALENLGIGDVGTVVEDVTEEKDQPKNMILPSSELPDKDSSVAEECISSISSNCAAFDPTTADTTSDSTTSKSSGSRGTSIKEVQWSAFNSDLNKQDGSAFGSYSDFFNEIPDNSTMLDSNPSPTARTMEEPISDFQSSSTYSEQQTSQNYGEVTQSITNGQDIYDIQYWESLYPGWRYDPATGQWHQIEGYDASRASQEGFQDKSDTGAGINFSDQTSEVSYLQQTAQSVVGTIAESGTISNISNWNGASQVTDETEYPSHMIFDPQYPGWYYDSIAQEWRSLESHVSASQVGSAVHNQQTEVATASSDSLSGEVSQAEQYNSQSGQNQGGTWGGSATYYPHQNTWQPETVAKSEAIPMGNFYGSTGHANSYVDHQSGLKPMETASSYEQANHGFDRSNGGMRFQSFASTENVHQFKQQTVDQNQRPQFSSNYYGNQSSVSSLQDYQTGTSAYNQTSYTPIEGKSSAGRPSHALVSFGFGGKLVIMKSDSSYGSSSSFGSQDSLGGSVSILNLAEVLDKTDATGPGRGACDYFHVLCQQSFPGPLVGGNVASKDLNKWVDERIAKCPSAGMDLRKGEVTRLLLSLLKISCQQYGKLRSPFGGDSTLLENDSPELAVTKLFASARKNSDRVNEYGSFPHCMQNVPSETQTRTTAVEVQNLLVSGRRKEALQRAHEGQLWGPALVLAAQLGEQFYVDTVKQMAHHQFMPGSPLRTLCLLIAKEPADVFSADTSVPDSVIPSQQRTKIRSNGMLDGWEENLAIITGNRTKGDELVIIHLGDCLWRERDEITAAHTCYLVAEANFESYSDSARLCLVGADHLKHPRTFASPEAIQRTELYEYSKVLGNSQYILLPFQPYKLIYAYMLAEVGKVADSLRYCQAILKVLKSPARAPEVETWKLLVSSLEERIRTHQQGGYSTNLAPGKLVGKLFTSIDRSISRMIGVPPPVPSTSQNSTQSRGRDTHSMVPKVATSQSTMAMSSLMPSASMEPISEWTGGGSRMTKQNRSISEPDFARSPKQVDQSKESGLGGKPSGVAGPSRFGRIGSQLLQKTMGWVSKSRTDRQAKLGNENKFYYDEKLKKWVEEGVEPPAEEAALPPPPTTTAFQNGTSDYNINSAFQSQGQSLPANGGPESRNPNPPEYSSGIPPIPPSSNQFSARGRMGVRSRYVDTFNKGGVAPTNLFQSPSAPVAKPAGGAKFFVPAATGSSEPSKLDPSDGIQKIPAHEDPVASAGMELLIPSVSVPSMQRYPSMDNITPIKNSALKGFQSGNGSLYSHSRAASWSGSCTDMKSKTTEIKSLGEVLGMPPSAFMSNGSSSSMYPSSASPLMNRCGSSGDELQEVEL